MWRNKFFRTLFYSFCLIIVIYSIGALGVYYSKNMEISRVERNSSQKLLLQQAQEMMDQRIQVALNAMIQLETSEAFKDYTDLSASELKYYHMGRVLQEIQRNKTAFSNYDYEIAVMLRGDRTVITSNYTVPAQNFLNELAMKGSARKRFDQFAKDNSWSSYFETISIPGARNADTLTLVKKYRVSHLKTVLFFLTFKKMDLLPEALEHQDDALLLVSGGEVLSLDQAEKKTLHQDVSKHIALRNEQVSSYSRMEKEGEIIHSIGSKSLKDLSYVYVTPKNPPQTDQNSQWLAAALLPALLVLAGMIIACALIWYTYKPVHKMVAALREEYPMESGEDEFLYIQETAKRIREVNRELTIAISQNEIPLKMKFLWDVLHGISSEEAIQKGIGQFKLAPFEKHASVTIIEFDYRLLNEARIQVSRETIRLLKEVLGDNVPFEMVELGPGRAALLTGKIPVSALKEKITSALKLLDREINQYITAAIGPEIEGFSGLDQSFQQASELLEKRQSMEKLQVLSMDDFTAKRKQTFYYPIEVEKELIHYFVQGKKEEAFRILHRILKENIDEKNLDKADLSQFVFAMAGTVNRIAQSSSSTSGGELLHLEFSEIRNRAALKGEIVKTFTSATDQIETNQNGSSTASQIVMFIQHHYHEDLSLQDLSERFQLTPSYISTIFKDHTGENYKEYLNRYRIQKAKELLADKKIKVHEASKLVGYNNVNTFIRIFKKYVGLSPGQYERSD
ncbi:helix-turn-helix domain-containing protein [Bacillus sp. FJAT-42376]|uniref:helix-turn-helix transcriptional regulator n=1 Tax=Bacillus sp. FJAT-42376 TaxID=2014076 RepID=UPI000F4DA386|nr:helix-turn-helix domain-containing protein [Bacillus sp. FJAT-42376]AZB42477.1 helix-turn-helix domain-containing protein [Bacillus sp. FJAT-42376]